MTWREYHSAANYNIEPVKPTPSVLGCADIPDLFRNRVHACAETPHPFSELQ